VACHCPVAVAVHGLGCVAEQRSRPQSQSRLGGRSLSRPGVDRDDPGPWQWVVCHGSVAVAAQGGRLIAPTAAALDFLRNFEEQNSARLHGPNFHVRTPQTMGLRQPLDGVTNPKYKL
jgi:hypothetical protein